VPTTLKVEITVKEEDGRVVVKTLEGDDAERWREFIEQVCLSAHVRGSNPNWGSLQWHIEEKREQ
jgi:hypothetical protein